MPGARSLALLLISACSVALADDLVLDGGGKLSGRISRITTEGHLLLETPLSASPLDVRADHVSRITFAAPEKIVDEHDSMVVLANGDQFPCDLESIDAAAVKVNTTFAGELTIPRQAMRTLQLGVKPRKTIYDGPRDGNGWDIKSGWHFAAESFIAEAQGVLSRKFEMPENHSIAFDLSWGSVPNLQVGIDDSNLEPNSKADRYVLSINGGGIDLKREQELGNRRFLPMGNVPRDFIALPDQTVSVELRIDRKLAIVSLYLDGNYEGRWADPLGHAPTGKGVYFRASVAGQDNLTVEGIQINEWDASSDRHRSEERGDRSKDSIILRDGDRGMGEILSYRSDDKEHGTLTYKMPHRAEPLATPATEISTLFFAEKPQPAGDEPPLNLTLLGRGGLSISIPAVEDAKLLCKHPLLGDLTIRREAVSGLARTHHGDSQESEESSEDDETGDQ